MSELSMISHETFPFCSVIKQNDVKEALILNLINPRIGGVLIDGPGGTGKSLIAGSLCTIADEHITRLPLNVSEDRLTGSVDVEKTLKSGKAVLEKGVLPSADGGILFIDDMALLPDEITELYLPAGSSVEKGTEVKAEWPTDLDKERPYYGETESGRWKFNGYDNDTATAGDEEIVFTGSWVYETPKTYTILNEAASTDETRPVPDDLPVYDTFTQNGYEGEVLTVVEPKEENKTFETEDGVWTYEYRDPETVTLGEEEELLITYYYSFSEAEPAEHEVSFVFESGTEGYEIPEELNIVCLQAPYMVPDGTEVEPDPIEDSPYEPEDGKGRWIFVGYEPEGSVVVDGEDVLFTGTWIYEEKLTYNVKSKCVSDTEGRSIPDGFPVHEAFKYSGYPGETLTPQEPLVDEYKTEDGVWNYSWTEPETVSLAEETELTILYHYEFTPTGTSTVTAGKRISEARLMLRILRRSTKHIRTAPAPGRLRDSRRLR